MRISADSLSQAIQEELESYADEIRAEVGSAVIRVAKRCLARIQQDSPRHSGEYRKGWAMRTEKGLLSTVATIYNRTRYFMIHLLENGHQKAEGGRVEGQPHVAPAADEAAQELLAEITNVLKER